MSEEILHDPAADLHEPVATQVAAAQASATEMLSTAAGYIKEHPWTALAGIATVAGAAALAIGAATRKPQPTAMDTMRGWIDEARAKLPTRREIDKAADRMGITDFIRLAGRKLHLLPGH